MKESFWGVFLVTLGIIGISVLNVLQTVTTTNENNYYLLREVAEASMFDSVDLGHYRRTGEIRIIEEKFVEVFMRRFSMTHGRTNNYAIGIYEIIEMPPKVSLVVEVDRELQIYNYEAVDFNINNGIDAILETKYGSEHSPAPSPQITSSPSAPGPFSHPTGSVVFKNNTVMNVAWTATPSWGLPSSGGSYRLEYKCDNNNWVLVADVTTTTASHNVICDGKSLQYRVRAESDAGNSDWRYSNVINSFSIDELIPKTYAYTGAVQQYVANESGNYKLEAWGAQGGGTSGGLGGYATGIKYLTAGQTIYVYVGGQGRSSTGAATGGYNGGGNSGSSLSSKIYAYNDRTGSGGGASDIRIGGSTNSHRVIVAGGGGGSGGSYGTGGSAGGSSGIGGGSYGTNGLGGVGGTQSAGGRSGSRGTNGTLGKGGNGGNAPSTYGRFGGGGGGGGYYGGGGGGSSYAWIDYTEGTYRSYYGGGGGGSSYAGGVTNGYVIAGNAYLPKLNGGSEKGHGGPGYVRITYMGSN